MIEFGALVESSMAYEDQRLRRGGWRRVLFTPDEDRRLETLRMAGRSLDVCAAVLGRGKSSVAARLKWLAERDEQIEG